MNDRGEVQQIRNHAQERSLAVREAGQYARWQQVEAAVDAVVAAGCRYIRDPLPAWQVAADFDRPAAARSSSQTAADRKSALSEIEGLLFRAMAAIRSGKDIADVDVEGSSPPIDAQGAQTAAAAKQTKLRPSLGLSGMGKLADLQKLASKCLHMYAENAWPPYRDEAAAHYSSEVDGSREHYNKVAAAIFVKVAQNTKGALRRLVRSGRIPMPDAAGNLTVAPVEVEERSRDVRRDLPELPPLDLSDAVVKNMIKQAKKRGYVTHEQIKSVMPSDVTFKQFDDVLAMMSEMGITVTSPAEQRANRT
jgi:hypothetical protein